jgi:site-specific recombinase XerC
VAEDEANDVMAGISHPKLEETPPAIITDDQLRRLLDVTKGREFIDRRDHAILRVLIDTGMRTCGSGRPIDSPTSRSCGSASTDR